MSGTTIEEFLRACKLSKYAAALEDAGYDDVEFLQTRSEDQLLTIAKMVEMPIGHAQRFVYAIEKHSTSESESTTADSVAAATAAPREATTTPEASTPATRVVDGPSEIVTPLMQVRSIAATASPGTFPQAAEPSVPGIAPPLPPPKSGEAVVICIDRSFSMRSPIDEMKAFGDNAEKTITRRSRMEAVKQIFYAFRDRVDTLDSSAGTHQLGLIQFDDKIDKMLDLTPALNNFEQIVDDVEARGSTAIYSVISCAVNMLRPVFEAHPQVDLRVLVLTDGESNAGVSPQAALLAVNSIGATVDAIIVGDQPDANLRRIVELTGGECFNIRSLSEGFRLMEAEAVVSLQARRGFTPKPPFVKREMPADFGAVKLKAVTSGTAVRSLVRRAATPMRVASAHTVAKAKHTGSAVNKRLLKELQNVVTSDLGSKGIHVLPDAASPSTQWRVLLEGPAGTPFENGVFSLLVTFPSNYPFQAPNVRFETPIYHCNVSDAGRICLEILHSRWAPSVKIVDVLQAIVVMMKNPDTDSALRSWIAELTIAHRKSAGTDTRYIDGAKQLTASEASLSVAEWKKKLGITS